LRDTASKATVQITGRQDRDIASVEGISPHSASSHGRMTTAMPITFESLVATTKATIAVEERLSSGRPERV
jgi:hypothetical protein